MRTVDSHAMNNNIGITGKMISSASTVTNREIPSTKKVVVKKQICLVSTGYHVEDRQGLRFPPRGERSIRKCSLLQARLQVYLNGL